MSEFKRIKELGLTVHRELYGNDREYVKADDLERLLENAVKVYAYMGPASRPGGMWINEGQQDSDSTHTALLLNVKPIASSDSWEKLERDIKGGRFDSLQVGRAFKEIAIRAVELMKEQK